MAAFLCLPLEGCSWKSVTYINKVVRLKKIETGTIFITQAFDWKANPEDI